MAAVAEDQEDLGISFFETFFPVVSCSSLAFFCPSKAERQHGVNER